jgi:hypothetical protein
LKEIVSARAVNYHRSVSPVVAHYLFVKMTGLDFSLIKRKQLRVVAQPCRGPLDIGSNDFRTQTEENIDEVINIINKTKNLLVVHSLENSARHQLSIQIAVALQWRIDCHTLYI